MIFTDKLNKQIDTANSLVCVGIDPVMEQLPERFKTMLDPFFEFGKWIIDETHKHVCSYKPNSAFYEAQGSKGVESLKKTCEYLNTNHPKIPIIIDAKRGDIGHTSLAYAKYVFDYLSADAVTLQPYLGSEALNEFFKYKEKGLIILCRTSNPGAGEFQDLETNGVPLWQTVAKEVSTTWKNKTDADLLLVIGATYPEELKQARKIAPGTTFLIPGIGKQGGDIQKTMDYGPNSNGRGVIINSSRGIIYSNNPRQAVKKLIQQIEEVS